MTVRAVLPLLLSFAFAASSPADCSWHFSESGNTYDLKGITRKSG